LSQRKVLTAIDAIIVWPTWVISMRCLDWNRRPAQPTVAGRERLPQTGQIRAGPVLTQDPGARHLPARTGRRSTITQIYEGTNQIQRVVMARQLLK
jgi:hypothetical protein